MTEHPAAPTTTEAFRELIRVSKSAGMNAASDFGYPQSTQQADEEEIAFALAEARAAARKEVLDELRETAHAFWSEESIKGNYAFHPNLFWGWLDSLSTDTRKEPRDE